MGVLPRLKAFLTEENRDELLARARSLFSPSVVRDDPNRPSEGEDFFDDLGAFSPLVEVGFVESVESGDVCAVVFEGRDPVADRWHRCSWVVRVERGLVVRITSTSQVIPAPDLEVA